MLLFGVMPAAICLLFLGQAYHQGILSFDFVHFELPAARHVAHGESPYPGYGYPPLVAFALVPFVWIPAANVVFTILLAACLPLSLWLLGVRDWRCYGVIFAWSPVLAALQTGNVTIPLLLGSAVCWRYRERWKLASVGGGLTIAAKLLTAPLIVWLAATRRWAAAAGVAAVAAGVSIVLWAALGFSYFRSYPSRVGSINDSSAPESYTLKVLLQDMGAGHTLSEAGWVVLALAIVAAIVFFGWRGDDRRSFAFAGVAMIAAIPVVWMHSFSLLMLPVAVMRPRLSLAWLLPILCFIGTGTGNGTPYQTAGVLLAAALTVVAAVLPESVGQRFGSSADTISIEAASESSSA